MKKIITGTELQEKILESISLLCDTVKLTLGPKGNNVIIDHSCFSPFITNDGVTIAKNIESEEECVATILEILKEASIKTNDEVGDGTTTTLVLLKSLYEQSLEHVKKGTSPIVLKKELDYVLAVILQKLQKLKQRANSEELKKIAMIAANDEELGLFAYQVFQKVKKKEAITIHEVDKNITSVSYLKGYACDTSLASPYFLKDTNELIIPEAYLLLMDIALTNLEQIYDLVNEVLKEKKDLIIIANHFDDLLVEEVISLHLLEDVHIYLLKIEEYGSHIHSILKDLEYITGANIIENENQGISGKIGIVRNIKITKEKIKLDFKPSKEIKNYVAELKKNQAQLSSDIEKSFFEKRIAMFSNGMAEIHLGAPTKTECIEKRMRLEDALCALSVSNQGFVLGEGISLLKIANELSLDCVASAIWKESLKKPFEQILKNAGLDFKNIQAQIEKKNFKAVYNISNNTLEDDIHTKVIDPFLVVINTLTNATSIAGMLLTTSCLIINEYQNNLNKETEYNSF